MNKNPKPHKLSSRSLLTPDYEMIDYEILQFEKKLEYLESKGHRFCSICCIELNNIFPLCLNCKQYE